MGKMSIIKWNLQIKKYRNKRQTIRAWIMLFSDLKLYYLIKD